MPGVGAVSDWENGEGLLKEGVMSAPEISGGKAPGIGDSQGEGATVGLSLAVISVLCIRLYSQSRKR